MHLIIYLTLTCHYLNRKDKFKSNIQAFPRNFIRYFKFSLKSLKNKVEWRKNKNLYDSKIAFPVWLHRIYDFH